MALRSRAEKVFHFLLNMVWAYCLRLLVNFLMLVLGKDYRQLMYGESMKATQFCLDMDTTTLNHGSYGTVPRAIQKVQRQFQVPDIHRRDIFMSF